MKKLFIIIGVWLIGLLPIYAKPSNMFSKKDNYKKQWAKVDSLERKGLPKDALKIVEEIYNKAKTDKNSDQLIKSLLYQIKFINATEEDGFEKLIKKVENQADSTFFPNDAMMHKILADLYWMYYQNNQWAINQRTTTVNFMPDDIKTWDARKFAEKVIAELMLSLKNADELQKISINEYEESIHKGTKIEIHPTLYDFLAFSAINYFKDTKLSLSEPIYRFEIKEEFYFANLKEFLAAKIETKDSLSLKFYAAKIFQDWLKFRIADTKNPDALIDADLLRLYFIRQNSVHPDKDKLYLKSLLEMEENYKQNEYVNYVSYQIAEFYFQEGSKFNATSPATNNYQWLKKKAADICNQIIGKKLKSIVNIKAENLLLQIKNKSFSFVTEDVILPNQTFAIKVDYANMNKLWYRIASIDEKTAEKLEEKHYGEDLYRALKKVAKPILTSEINTPDIADYQLHSFDYLPKAPDLGYYIIFLASSPDFEYEKNCVQYAYVRASELSCLERKLPDGSLEIFVKNRKTGKAIENVSVTTFKQEYSYVTSSYKKTKLETKNSNTEGYVKFNAATDYNYATVYIELQKDKDFLKAGSQYIYRQNTEPGTVYSINLFTDRAIYRPGQTIYFKGIALSSLGNKHEILKNYKTQVIFYDVNYQKISELDVTTNEYGTFSGNFVIPTGLLNGQMRLYTSHGEKYIRVEEYKRPKFEAKLLPFKGNYRLNDEVSIKGEAKAYSGAALTDADVKYRIIRKPIWRGWWYYYFPQAEMEIANGTIKTGDNGEFEIKFKALPDLSQLKNEYVVFNYTIIADVTDINGETQSTSGNLTVGTKALQISLNVIEKFSKNTTDSVAILTTNLSGEFIEAQGTVEIFKLNSPQTTYRERLWTAPDTFIYSKDEWEKLYPGNLYQNETEITKLEKGEKVLTTEFNTAKKTQIALQNIKKWPVGQYVAISKSKDAFGQDVSYNNYFTIFDEESNKLPHNTPFWTVPVNIYGQPGDNAKVLIGTSLESEIRYEIEFNGKIIEASILKLNNEQKSIEIPIKEEYRGNFTIHFSSILNGRKYTAEHTVFVPFTNKQLDFEYSTFRNKLLPGQQEEWTLKIKGKKGEKVAAEMMATLYDASIDVFAKNYWNFDVWRYYYTQLRYNGNTFGISNSESVQNSFNPYGNYYSESYESFNWFGFYYDSYDNFYFAEQEEGDLQEVVVTKSVRNGRAVSKKSKESGMVAAELSKDEVSTIKPSAPASVSDDENKQTEDTDRKDDSAGGGEEKPQIRKNFAETAFFLPDLQTDEEGNVLIKFTIPEALTRWRFMGLAHTQDLSIGLTENETVTQKDLMLLPNMPRFLRENDKIELSTKISNVSDNNLSGTVKLELFDAFTMQPISGIFEKNSKQEQGFSVNAKQNTSATWALEIPEGISAVVYRLVAKAGAFSDGEENVIPVLTNRMLVTESLPLPIRSYQTKTFEFGKLINSGKSSTLRHHKLTLEFSSQPAWYAIQALPYIMEYPYECAEQTFSRFYANSIATHIANSSPKIKRVFDSWKQNKESLLSNLEKNQELKSVLLEETPWVMDAQNEGDRKQRVGVLFDLNKMSYELESAMKKLQKMQVSNGAWPWFPGMPESRYITQHIVCGMGHLDNLGIKNIRNDSKIWTMLTQAISYLDEQLLKDYKWLEKNYTEKQLKENHLSQIAIHYLYARSYFTDVEIPKRVKVASDYYLNQGKKYWLSQDLYEQGMLALMLQRFGDKTVTADIMKSLKQRAQNHEELGMYWKENTSGYWWYQAPIETQAMMIEAFDEVAKDSSAVDALKVWLLKQKQTQDWKTTKSTVEAIYALLLRGASPLESDKLVKIEMGGQQIDPHQIPGVEIEAGTGYFKTSWAGGEIKPEMGKIKVTKEDAGVAWGAVYWQYFEQLDKITPAETPLKLDKKLFKEVITDRGKTIEPLDNTATLKVGDKVIVRIELRVDRDMEYVHMKDMRASGFEPINVMSVYKYQGGIGYYESTKDAATNFFMDYLRKGTYVFEYPLLVAQVGDFSNGITQIQCMYAPEFTSHSEGVRVQVEK